MKHLIIIFMSLITLATNANADSGEIQDCIPASQFTLKIQNGFFKSDLDNYDSFMPCSEVIDATKYIATIEAFADKDNVRFIDGFIKNRTHRYQEIEDAMPEENHNQTFIQWCAVIFGAIVATFFTIPAITSIKQKETSKGGIYAVFGGLLTVLIFKFADILVFIFAWLNGWMSFVSLENAAFGDFEAVRDANFEDIAPALNQNNALLYASVQMTSVRNEVTKQHLRKKWFGTRMTLDATIMGDESNTKHPTFEEYNDYRKHCEKLDRAETNSEVKIHVMNLSFSYIPVTAEMYSGGNTSEWNCSKHYGWEETIANNHSKTSTAITRFLEGLIEPDMATDLNVTQEMKAAFDKQAGEANLLLEKVSEKASENVQLVESELQLALTAIKDADADENNSDPQKTSSYETLEASHTMRMGDIFNFSIDDMSSIDQITLSAVAAQQFKNATLAGYKPNNGSEIDYIDDKYEIGYYYLFEFVNETSRMALEKECIRTDGQNGFGNRYKDRDDYATLYNSYKDEPLHTLGTFGGVSEPHCYKFVGDKLVAGANPADLKSLEKEIEQRNRAVMLWLTAMDNASTKLILDKPELNDDLLVDFLNTLDTSFQSSVDTHLVFTDLKQKLMQSFNTVSDSFYAEFTSNDLGELYKDTNQPQVYFNFEKFYTYSQLHDDEGNLDLGTIITSRGLKHFDLSEYFKDTAYALDELELERKLEAKGNMSEMLKPICPVYDQTGTKCVANAIQIVSALKEQFLQATLYLTAFKVGATAGAELCDLTSVDVGSGMKMSRAGVFGQALCAIMYGADAIDNTIVTPSLVLTGVITAGLKVSLLLPSIGDLFTTFIFPLLGLVFFAVFIPLVIFLMVKNTIVFLSNYDEEDALDKLMNFDPAVKLVKSFSINIVLMLLLTALFFHFLTSSYGGVIYDLFIKYFDVETNIFVQIAIIIALAIAMIYFCLKFILSVLSDTKDYVHKIFETDAPTSRESSDAMTAAVGGYLAHDLKDHIGKIANAPSKSMKNMGQKNLEKKKSAMKSSVDQHKSVNTKVSNESDTPIKAKEKSTKESKESKESMDDMKSPELKQEISFRVRSDKDKKDIDDLLNDINKNNPKNGKND